MSFLNVLLEIMESQLAVGHVAVQHEIDDCVAIFISACHVVDPDLRPSKQTAIRLLRRTPKYKCLLGDAQHERCLKSYVLDLIVLKRRPTAKVCFFYSLDATS